MSASSESVSTVLPLTKIPVEVLAERVLVVGDPARAERISRLLTDPEPIAATREYHSYRGRWKDVAVTVVSHGVGAPGAGICFEELCRGGARRIVRVGTAGGLQPNVVAGDVVIATGAVREDGLTDHLVPPAYPAVADLDTTVALVRAASSLGIDTHQGLVATMANFFASRVLPNGQVIWRDAGVLAVEMEVAALFVVAMLSGVQAGAVVAIDGNPLADEDADMVGYNPHRDVVDAAVKAAITIGLDALAA